MYKVECQECDFESEQPTFSNADIVRDNHELEMFNWGEDESACGPCEITKIE